MKRHYPLSALAVLSALLIVLSSCSSSRIAGRMYGRSMYVNAHHSKPATTQSNDARFTASAGSDASLAYLTPREATLSQTETVEPAAPRTQPLITLPSKHHRVTKHGLPATNVATVLPETSQPSLYAPTNQNNTLSTNDVNDASVPHLLIVVGVILIIVGLVLLLLSLGGYGIGLMVLGLVFAVIGFIL